MKCLILSPECTDRKCICCFHVDSGDLNRALDSPNFGKNVYIKLEMTEGQ